MLIGVETKGCSERSTIIELYSREYSYFPNKCGKNAFHKC